jgi:hypothetical protein
MSNEVKVTKFVGIFVRCTVHLVYNGFEMSNEVKVTKFAQV